VVRRVFSPDEIAAAVHEAGRLVRRKDLIDTRNLRCRWQPHCDGGDHREQRYREFLGWLREKYADYGKTNVYFA
jgi:hypothetical protein